MSALSGTGPVILALDTATERLCAALHDGRTIHSHEEAGGAAASARLLPALQQLLARAGIEGSALDAIAFVQGPGAFTGLRTACSVTQGLAWAWQKPVLPLDALMLLAEDLRGAHGCAAGDEVAVAVDARMDEIYAARYTWDGAAWSVLEPPALWAWAALAEAWPGSRSTALKACVGSALSVFADRMRWPAATVHRADAHDRAAALGRLALQAWSRGAAVAAADALPLYLRDKVAQTTLERAALAAHARS